jgi:amidase
VKTWSVDAGGTDPKGVRRTSGGNPLTGPFYIDGALPGDALIVHFNRIRLNRDTAISSPLIANIALNPAYVEQRKRVEGYNSDWKLDRDATFASLQKPTGKLKDYRVPLAGQRFAGPRALATTATCVNKILIPGESRFT